MASALTAPAAMLRCRAVQSPAQSPDGLHATATERLRLRQLRMGCLARRRLLRTPGEPLWVVTAPRSAARSATQALLTASASLTSQIWLAAALGTPPARCAPLQAAASAAPGWTHGWGVQAGQSWGPGCESHPDCDPQQPLRSHQHPTLQRSLMGSSRALLSKQGWRLGALGLPGSPAVRRVLWREREAPHPAGGPAQCRTARAQSPACWCCGPSERTLLPPGQLPPCN
jgi:hypothetical protein